MFIQRAFNALAGRSVPSNIERRSNPLENPATSLASGWMWTIDEGRGSDAGEFVNDRTALMEATVFACVRTIAEAISPLPLRLLKVDDTGRSAAIDEPLYHLLATAPNEETSSVTFWETMVTCLALRGNAYAQIQRDGNGQPVALWQLNPHQVTVQRNQAGSLVYRVNVNPEGETPRFAVLDKADILHFRLFGMNGITGISPVDMQRQVIGLGIGQTKHAARLFRNGSVPSLALINKAPQPISPTDKTKMREDWETLQTGANTHRVAILDNDFDIKTLGLTAEQSQFLQSRAFTLEQLCGVFKVPSNMVGSQAKATHANLEQQQILFLTQCLVPYLVRIENEIKVKLLPRDSRFRNYVAEWDTSLLLRGDSASQAAWYTAGVQGGWLSPAEVRHLVGFNPAPAEAGLNVYRVPVNYQNAAMLIGQTRPVTQNATASPNDPTADDEPLALPDADGDPDPAEERTALRQYGRAYLPLFTNAVRNVVNGGNLTQTFGPLIESVCELTASQAGTDANLTRLISYLSRLENRAAAWKSETAEQSASEELQRAVRAFVFGSHEDKAERLLLEASNG